MLPPQTTLRITVDKTRYNRIAQRKHRGSKTSPKTDLENAYILLAWLNADLSEGQASKALQVDRVTLREMRDVALAKGLCLFEKLYPRLDAQYDGVCGALPNPPSTRRGNP